MPPFLPLLLFEILVLGYSQRRLMPYVLGALPRTLAYVLVAPGVIVHETSHLLACRLLGVPAGSQVFESRGKRARVSFFRPQENPDGSVTFGYVPHAQSDPVRSNLISIAPLLLAPPLLVLCLVLIFGQGLLEDPMAAISRGGALQIILACYLSVSVGPAAFPSIGDEVSLLVLVPLALLALLAAPSPAAAPVINGIALVFLPATAGALILSSLFFVYLRRRR